MALIREIDDGARKVAGRRGVADVEGFGWVD
jgi:hypothetical protein